VRAYAVAGSFDDCHRLTREAFRDPALRRQVPMTSANSVNVGRLLPQMIYYFHAIAQLTGRAGSSPTARAGAELAGQSRSVGAPARTPDQVVFCTPSGNFGNLTAGLMAKRAGLPIARFVAATNVNDVVPEYLLTGRFQPRASVQTLTNAMDVGHPSNFERMSWLYDHDLDAMRRDVVGARYVDDEVRDAIQRTFETRGYLLDPHSAIAYLGIRGGQGGLGGRVGQGGRVGRVGQGDVGIFLATAHPAKFAEIVEPIIGRAIPKPAGLAEALAQPRQILRIDATLDAVKDTLVS
jgi:threonine synthase